jgi:hypothetical protein
MKKTIISLASLFGIVCISVLPSILFAVAEQTTTGPNPNVIHFKIKNPLNFGDNPDIGSIVTGILEGIVMPLAGVLVVLAILYSGFKFVTAQGNAKAIEDARTGLLWVLVGAVVLLGATGIAKVLDGTIRQILS